MFLKSDVVLERGKEGEVVPRFPSTITQSVVAPKSEFFGGGEGDRKDCIPLYYARYATLLFSTILFLLYTLPLRNFYPSVKI